jgi:ribosome-binding factor A
MPYHNEKLAEQLRELAAKFIHRESNRSSLITVTSVRLSDRNKRATICVTAFPESKEDAAIDFIKRKRSEFREFVKDNSQIGLIPFFDFEVDLGEKNRQRIDELLNQDKKERPGDDGQGV